MKATTVETVVEPTVAPLSRKDQALAFLTRMDNALDTGAQKTAKVAYPFGWVTGKVAQVPMVGVAAKLAIYGAIEFLEGAQSAQLK